MLSRVLVAMNDSEMARQALRYALEAYPGAEITVLSVVGVPSAMWGEATAIALASDVERSADEHAQGVLDTAREIAAEYDVEIETAVEVGPPVPAILDWAEGFDTIVVGSHAGAISERLFVGNVAEALVHRSPIPVTVVR
ncbi:MAG: universal stress protein [Haloarculaceae archaeon]